MLHRDSIDDFERKVRSYLHKRSTLSKIIWVVVVVAIVGVFAFTGVLRGDYDQILQPTEVQNEDVPIGFSCRPTLELARTLPFTFDTNSTIGFVDFDAKSKQLTIKADGPDNTIGVFCINIPKAMFGERLKTTIDDVYVDAEIEEVGESYVVILTYDHGTSDQAESNIEPEIDPDIELKPLKYIKNG
jgi:hypothetical protein